MNGEREEKEEKLRAEVKLRNIVYLSQFHYDGEVRDKVVDLFFREARIYDRKFDFYLR